VVAATGGWFATLDWWNGFFPLLASVLFGITVAMLGFGPARPRPSKAPKQPADGDPGSDPAGEHADGPADGAEQTAVVPGGPADQAEESGLLRVWRGSDPSR
jgi:hypothetical protein